MMRGARGAGGGLAVVALVLLSAAALAQPAPGSPPAVGVVRVERRQITESEEFIGRIQAVGRVSLVARVTAFLDKRNFVEGSEVKKGDLLYVLEQAPFQAEVNSAQAAVDQYTAQHRNALLALERARALLATPAGQQSTYDAAYAAERALAAQIAGAQAQLQTAQINLGYTEIRAPIDGRISSTAVTEGNVVSPTSGTLATIVSQDPIYVLFPVAQRTALDLRSRYGPKGGFGAVVIRLRLPDGRLYDQEGHLDYVSPTVAENTDTLTLRGVIPNPRLPIAPIPGGALRELTDGEFVTVLLEGVQPVTVLAIPRAAVLADQRGDYVYVVNAQNRAEVRRIELGQSTPATAVVISGLAEGETVISEGVQRVRPGEPVAPAPATPPPVSPAADPPAGTANGRAGKP
jgi:membrane fusion protein (multidrug efflux system)